MQSYPANLKRLVLCISVLFTLSFSIITHAEASSRSRVFEITLFASGLGLQVGSTVLNTSAQEQYETYLNATIQSDIESQREAVVLRQNSSVIMRRVGYGCIGLAVLLSIFNQMDTTDIETVTTPQMQSTTNLMNLNNTPFSFSQVNQILEPSRRLSLHPHYDFQTQRASLQILHKF